MTGETELFMNDNWYHPPCNGDNKTKVGKVDCYSLSPTTGLFATLSTTYRGKDDVRFDVDIDHELSHKTYDDIYTLSINPQNGGPSVFTGEITDTVPYGDGAEEKVVEMYVTIDTATGAASYKVSLDLDDGNMEFSIELVMERNQDVM